MFTRSSKFNRNFYFSLHKNFSQKSNIIIIGAGTGGVSLAKQLALSPNFDPNDITIFDPSKTHHYQPGWTKIAGLPNKMDLVEKSKFNVEELLDTNKNGSRFNFQNVAVKSLDPDNNRLEDENGEEWTYDQLIVSCGIKVNHDSIPGKLF